ncbi:P-loop containing nucleoside triphosphate hydrolase protein [Blastocladiella britannica]|nr:P-loop containing nucleoside triphosphate hydrolase protein [Blastocladiella britannica]
MAIAIVLGTTAAPAWLDGTALSSYFVAAASEVRSFILYLKTQLAIFQQQVLAAMVYWVEWTTLPGNPSSLLTAFHSLRSMALAVIFRSFLLQGSDSFAILLALAQLLGSLILVTLVSGIFSRPQNVVDPQLASPFAKVSLMWIFPLLKSGNRAPPVMDDLPPVNKFMASARLEPLYQQLSGNVFDHTTLHRLVVGVLRRYWVTIALAFLSNLVALLAIFAAPPLLDRLLRFVSLWSSTMALKTSARPEVIEGVLAAVGLFVCANIATVGTVYSYQLLMTVQMRLRLVVQAAIYKKSLKLSAANNSSIGEIVSRMSIDTSLMVSAVQDLNDFWALPVTLTVGLYLLYQQVGPASFAALALLLTAAPTTFKVSTSFIEQSSNKLKHMDGRLKILSEVLANIKLIKLRALEDVFLRKLVAFRDSEQAALRKIYVTLSFVTGMAHSSEIYVTLLTFTAYALTSPSPSLEPNRVFVSSSILAILMRPLLQITELVSTVLTSLVSYRRIVSFFESDEVMASPASAAALDPDVAIDVFDATFSWGKRGSQMDKEAFALSNVSFQVRRGTLTAVVGRIGSGKSLMLHGLLGELPSRSGTVTMGGSVAYVPQQPWILSGSVRDNILFSAPLDESRYQTVVAACALDPDFELLPDGDQTIIGDKGTNLSGGQKARLALARAVYADHDVYLLDDCLSAVDVHVGKHIFDHVIGPGGLLQKKTVVFATHGIQYLDQCDAVVSLKDGAVASFGPVTQSDLSSTLVGEGAAATAITVSVDASPDKAAEFGGDTADEAVASGRVILETYMTYLRACGISNLAMFVPCFVLGVAVTSAHSYWLDIMSTAVAKGKLTGESVDLTYYLGIYGALSGATVLFMAAVTAVALIAMSIRACRAFHLGMITSILGAAPTWFDSTPAGQILNRNSNDIESLDMEIPMSLVKFSLASGTLLSTFIILGITAPWILLLAPIALAYLLVIARFFIRTSRQLQRLNSATRAPVYHQFEETLHGLVSIRTFGKTRQFEDAMNAAMDRNSRVAYMLSSSTRWLTIQTNFLGSLFILGVGLMAVWTRGSALAAAIGLGITQAQSLVSSFQALVTCWCDLEAKMVAVERIEEYSRIPQEETASTTSDDKNLGNDDWPSHGHIAFDHFSTAYRADLPPVLKDISVVVPAGCKVGVVGRTGAGKSSLMYALFRLMKATDGRILLDGVDIARVGLKRLRSQLCIIPQDPALFEGTIQSNLDPRGVHSDDALWRALEVADLSATVSALPFKLQSPVSHGGSGFSAGQKQLFMLASAVLNKRKIVVFDEAMSATDAETDAVVQRAIRAEFKGCTILTIAHRINTIRDSDRILVLDKGQVAEYNTPEVLLADRTSVFAALVEAS